MSFPEPQTVAVRTCSRCHAVKPIDEFAIKERTRGTRRSYCRPCARAYGREHYERNRAYYLAKARRSRARFRAASRDLAYDYLKTHPCVDCGESDPVVLEFDHRDPGTKLLSVSELIRHRSAAMVAAEIEKCDVRCVNCHRRRTASQIAGGLLASRGG